MPNKYYRIKYILAREERTGKIRQHLSTTLTWSRMFYRVEPVGQDETLAYGDWKTMDGDMKNFSIYYPHDTFQISVWGKNAEETDAEVFTFAKS
jgi:hypothetical protein